MTNTEKKYNIAFVGAGNVAWHLAQAFTAAGHTVVAVYSRSAASREELAGILPNAAPVSVPDFTGLAVDVILIAVPDAALQSITSELKVKPGTTVAHTSGSQPLAILQHIQGAMPAVFYPLQTFSKTKDLDLKKVPILLEATQESVVQQLECLAQSISGKVHEIDSDARRQIHLAAVFACNFTNHLLGISQQLLQEANLPTELLHPLVQETVAKAMQQNPYLVQTGPAIRHDNNVIQAHLHMLQEHPLFKEIYQKLTESIQATKV
ncbi:putative short-subunit dehydrogenase-like oxidoreductase (DUF2520 family) [Pontibacter aydingkolensis]|uniref:DUF2520 domain-containing protein n=1 Tax=Pontibacter aydingkolensis TaxID=1911536 RepID=A0ABS7CPW2_9BACT|nr:Rossmann-like and DUF2520 domain-containing protein [Pontibacter aydingkolensis]MBW7465873.1 DUF2520 domain-containing protein [Pontibacter aydingkolensis]